MPYPSVRQNCLPQSLQHGQRQLVCCSVVVAASFALSLPAWGQGDAPTRGRVSEPNDGSAIVDASQSRNARTTEADTNGLWLAFPVPGYTPFTAPVSAVFDHSGSQRYTMNGTVLAYPGVMRTATTGSNDGCYSNNQQVTLPGISYVGAAAQGGKNSLCYDGHPGWDYAFGTGTEVRAAADGWVVDVAPADEVLSGSGCQPTKPCNTVYIRHDLSDTIRTYYLHLSVQSGRSGQFVLRGEPIGKSGKVGAGSPHLHFEVRRRFGSSWGPAGAYSVDPYGTFTGDPYPYANIDLWTPPVTGCGIAVGVGASNPSVFTDAFARNGGQPAVGCPTNAVHTWGDGSIQDFSGGSGGTGAIMLRNQTMVAYYVHGSIWSRYVSLGGATGILGYPTSDEGQGTPSSVTGAQLKYSNFVGGALEHHATGPLAGQTLFLGHGILNKWLALGAGASRLGLPVSDEFEAATSPYGTTGRAAKFESGEITWHRNGSGQNQAFATHGGLSAYYLNSAGGHAGCLGFPKIDQYYQSTTGYWIGGFEGGEIRGNDTIGYSHQCGSPQPAIHVVAPNGGETWLAGSVQQVTWTASGLNPLGQLQIWWRNGSNWNFIGYVAHGTGTYYWNVPPQATTEASMFVGNLVGGVWEAYDNSDQNFAIVASTLRVASPNGGEYWLAGSTQQITWTSSNLNPSGFVCLYSVLSGSWTQIGCQPTVAANSYSWTVPNTPTASGLIWIGYWTNGALSIYDHSDQYFAIASSPTLQLVSPNGGENWTVGSVRQIAWTSSGLDPNGTLCVYSIVNGFWTQLSCHPSTASSYLWRVPNTPTTAARVWIGLWVNGGWQRSDQSDQYFRISP